MQDLYTMTIAYVLLLSYYPLRFNNLGSTKFTYQSLHLVCFFKKTDKTKSEIKYQ